MQEEESFFFKENENNLKFLNLYLDIELSSELRDSSFKLESLLSSRVLSCLCS